MTTCFLTNHYFSKTSSVVQKCPLRRLISKNTRKTTSDMALLASRKMENISRKGMLYMKTLANNCLKSFQFKQHLNNVHKEQPSKIDWAGYVEASYVVALCIAKAKKSWDFAELVQPCLRNCAKIVLVDRACNTLKQVSPSPHNHTFSPQSRFLPLILVSRCWWSENNRKNHIKN